MTTNCELTVKCSGPPPPAGPPKRDWLDPKLLIPLIQALVVLWLGWILTSRVTAAIERRKLEISAVKEMRDLVSELQSPATGLTLGDATAKAAALALYGEYSVPVFVQLVDKPDEIVPVAAQSGLRFVAQQSPAEVLRQMRRVLLNRTQVYGWRAHKVAVETVAELEGKAALQLLLEYRRNFPPDQPAGDSANAREQLNDNTWQATLIKMVSHDGPPGPGDAKSLRESLTRGINALQNLSPMYLRP